MDKIQKRTKTRYIIALITFGMAALEMLTPYKDLRFEYFIVRFTDAVMFAALSFISLIFIGFHIYKKEKINFKIVLILLSILLLISAKVYTFINLAIN